MLPQDAGRPEPTGNSSHPRPSARPVAGRIEPTPAGARPPAGPPPPALSAAPDAGALLRALRRRWLTAAVLCLLLGGAAAGAAWYLMTPQYTSFVTLRVANPTPIVFGDGAAGSAQGNYMRSQAAAFKSRRVILAALRQDEVKRLGLEARYPDPVDWIETQMRTEVPEGGEFLTVLLNASDPTDAMTVLKNVTNSYMDEVVYAEQTAKASRLADVEKIYTDTSSNLNRKRENFKQDAERIGTAIGSSDHDVLTFEQKKLLETLHDAKMERNGVNTELGKVQAELEALAIRQDAGQKLDLTDDQVEAQVEADHIAGPQLARLTALKELVHNIQDKTDDARNPTLVQALSRIREVEEAVEKRRSEVKEAMKNRLSTAGSPDFGLAKAQLDNAAVKLTKNLTDLNANIKDMEAKAEKIGAWNNDLEAQREEIARLSKTLNEIGDERNKLTVELKAPARVSVWQNADLQRRDLKKQALAAAAAPVAVVLFVCMAVAWLDVRQRRVRSAGEVATGLGIRVVGAVPGVPHLERRLVGPNGEPELEGHPVLDSFDSIRTQLLRDDGAEAARVLLVTSASAREGKTTLAAHLASSLARAGRKTLLIDGDLRTPSVHQLFEQPQQPGFSEVLLGEVEAAEAVQNTAQDGLAIMAAGQWDREVMQALARDGLEGIFDKLREEFDFIIVDSHPVLSATDSLLLGQHVDAAILAVLRDVSRTPRVYSASQKLASLGIRVLGAVVNGADPDEVFAAAPAPARQRAAG